MFCCLSLSLSPSVFLCLPVICLCLSFSVCFSPCLSLSISLTLSLCLSLPRSLSPSPSLFRSLCLLFVPLPWPYLLMDLPQEPDFVFQRLNLSLQIQTGQGGFICFLE